MNKLIALSVMIMLGACSTFPDLYGRDDGGMPSDVSRFMKQRSACDRYSQDAVFDDDSQGMALENSRIFCSGSDAELQRLRTKYANQPAVISTLNRFEAQLAEGAR